MEIKELQKRLEKKEIQIAKIEKRIAKWEATKSDKAFKRVYDWCERDTGWWNKQTGKYDLPYDEFKEQHWDEHIADCNKEIRYANRDLQDAQATLKKYQEALAIEVNKENSPKIEVLVKFLEGWKEEANKFYHDEAIRLYNIYEEHEKNNEQIDKMEFGQERRNASNEEYKRYNEQVKYFSPLVRELRTYREPYIDEKELEKVLTKEVKAKYEDLVYRMKDVVGELTDCSLLYVGGNDSINGIVIGTNGKARVETITAGGYNQNIVLDSGRHGQCLHYRVLVNKLKGE